MPPGEDPRDWDNFSPRLSVAYDVEGDGRSVMRVGSMAASTTGRS